MDALFTEDQSKVAATVHIPYMKSNVCWGKGVKKKKKKRENAANMDPNCAIVTIGLK